MDILAHALYGATACSRKGLAGGLAPEKRPLLSDPTVGAALLFGILPDVVSMGIPLVIFIANGSNGNFFHHLDGPAITVYRYMHSLVIALAFWGLVRLRAPRWSVPALAWPVHVVMDALTHGSGKFQTTVFYPLSTWAPEGIRWWQHPKLILAYWLALPAIWLALAALRRRRR